MQKYEKKYCVDRTICHCVHIAKRNQPTNMKATTKRAINKYGIDTCIEAYIMHIKGNGANTVAHSFSILKGNTNAADAAINAGRDLDQQCTVSA